MNLFDQIIANTYTVSDLHRRVQLVKTYLTGKFFSKGSELRQDRDGSDRTWLASLDLRGVTKDNLSETLHQLEEQAKNVEPLILFLPLLPPHNEVQALGERVRKDFGNRLLVELRLEPLLIAGAAVAYKGIYKDYSLRQSLKENHDTLVAGFKKYMR